MIAKRVIVRGRVQGVGFRFAVVDQASALDVAGWVRNRRDGSVEAWLQGPEPAVDRMIEWCRRGPPAASVTSVEHHDEPVDASLRGFAARPTA